MTLTARLLFGFVLIAAGGFYFITDQVLRRVERQYLEAVEEPMVDAANVLAAALEQDIKNGSLDATRFAASFASAKQREFDAKIYALTKTRINLDAYVTDDKGRVLFDSTDPAAVGRSLTDRRDVRITLAGGYGARSTRTDDEDDDSSVMYVGAPIRDGPRIVGVVSVTKPQRAVFHFRDETRRWLLWHISMIIVCMVLASYLLAKWAARPVERLTEYALAITRGERPVAPRLPGSDLKTLGQAFEKMRDELQGREYVENYVQTLTHELKSPVA
ncbi:MAG: HAMP domain-containing protein, partial [Prosthecobacter sp.]